jgi:hypothetical protein
MSETIKGFKGFDKDFKCRGFQFKEGKEYETDKAKACEAGFHACEYPLDVFGYYDPANSIFHEVEQSGKLDKNSDDSKVASTKIKIGVKIDFKAMIQASFEYVKKRCTNSESGKNNSALNGGYRSALNGGDSSALNGGDSSALNGGDSSALNGGDRSALNGGYSSALNGGDSSALNGGYRSALNGGDRSALNGGYRSALNGGDSSALNGGDSSALNGGYRSALNGGYRSALNGGSESKLTGGKYCVVYGSGIDAQVRGGLGSVLALAEFDDGYNLIKVHVKAVDGKKIKADTFYKLQKGQFVMVK